MSIPLQVTNPDEYGVSHYAIESEEYGNHGLQWAVRCWDERGLPEIEGPFASYEEAARALREHSEYLAWRGYSVVSSKVKA